MNEVTYQVLVASALNDLEAEFRLVQETLVMKSAFVSGFPFPDKPDNYLHKLNQGGLTRCDYLYLLLGNEYGPLAPTGVGYTHQLVASAQAMGKPVVVLAYQGEKKRRRSESDFKRLQEFMHQLKGAQLYHWYELNSLKNAVAASFQMLTEHHPARGWVRSDHVSQVQQHQDVTAMKRQIALLSSEMESLRRRSLPSLPEREIKLSYQCKTFQGGAMKTVAHHTLWTVEALFRAIAPAIISEEPEGRVRAGFCEKLLEEEKERLTENYPRAHAIVDLKLSSSSFNHLKAMLRAYGLIQVAGGLWKLTPYGEQHLYNRLEAG